MNKHGLGLMFLICVLKTSCSFTWSSDLHWSQSAISAARVYLTVSLISRRTWINKFMFFLTCDIPLIIRWIPKEDKKKKSHGISASAHFHGYDDIHLTCQIKAVFVSVTLKHERAFRADKSKKEIGWFLPASQPRESLWIQHTFGMLSFLSWLEAHWDLRMHGR